MSLNRQCNTHTHARALRSVHETPTFPVTLSNVSLHPSGRGSFGRTSSEGSLSKLSPSALLVATVNLAREIVRCSVGRERAPQQRCSTVWVKTAIGAPFAVSCFGGGNLANAILHCTGRFCYQKIVSNPGYTLLPTVRSCSLPPPRRTASPLLPPPLEWC